MVSSAQGSAYPSVRLERSLSLWHFQDDPRRCFRATSPAADRTAVTYDLETMVRVGRKLTAKGCNGVESDLHCARLVEVFFPSSLTHRPITFVFTCLTTACVHQRIRLDISAVSLSSLLHVVSLLCRSSPFLKNFTRTIFQSWPSVSLVCALPVAKDIAADCRPLSSGPRLPI